MKQIASQINLSDIVEPVHVQINDDKKKNPAGYA